MIKYVRIHESLRTRRWSKGNGGVVKIVCWIALPHLAQPLLGLAQGMAMAYALSVVPGCAEIDDGGEDAGDSALGSGTSEGARLLRTVESLITTSRLLRISP